MRKHIIAAIQAHAAAQYPKECCGLLLAVGRAQKYLPCRNIATEASEEFRLDPEDCRNGDEVLATVVDFFDAVQPLTSWLRDHVGPSTAPRGR